MGVTRNMKNLLFMCRYMDSWNHVGYSAKECYIQGFQSNRYFRSQDGNMYEQGYTFYPSITNTDANNVWSANPSAYRRFNWYGYVGTGTEPEQLDDYKITTMSDTDHGFSYVVSQNEDGDTVTRFTISGTNNTGSDKVITEVGIFRNFWMYTGSPGAMLVINSNTPGTGFQSSPQFLMIRKLLNTPITVANGGRYVVTIDYVES